jgi:hypothetical protein
MWAMGGTWNETSPSDNRARSTNRRCSLGGPLRARRSDLRIGAHGCSGVVSMEGKQGPLVQVHIVANHAPLGKDLRVLLKWKATQNWKRAMRRMGGFRLTSSSGFRASVKSSRVNFPLWSLSSSLPTPGPGPAVRITSRAIHTSLISTVGDATVARQLSADESL